MRRKVLAVFSRSFIKNILVVEKGVENLYIRQEHSHHLLEGVQQKLIQSQKWACQQMATGSLGVKRSGHIVSKLVIAARPTAQACPLDTSVEYRRPTQRCH